MYIDNPKIDIEIYEWTTSINKKKHIISDIYRDDQIDIAVRKILNFLQYDNIYLWIDNEIIEFNTSEELNNINPFLYDHTNGPKNKLIFTDKKGLFLYSKINLVNIETFKSNKEILNIFFKYQRPQININEKTLNELYNQTETNTIQSAIITFYEFDKTISLDKTLKYYYRNNKYEYDVLFWVYDNYNKHITVKNIKNYSIIINDLNNTKYDNEQLIIIKYFSDSLKYYYKITIHCNGYINVKFYLGNKSKYSIEKVLKLKTDITKLFKDIREFNDVSLKSQISLKANNFSKELFIKNSSRIYNFINTQDNFYIYNRTSNNTQSYDINTYIKELYNTFKPSPEEIVSILLPQIDKKELSAKELLILVNNVISDEEINLTKTKKIYFTQKTFFTINKTDTYKITITVNNIKSILELGYFNFWLSKITYNNSKQLKKPDKKPISSSSSSSSSKITSDSSDNSLKSFDSNESLSGGVPYKNTKIKQLNTLKILDPDLFNESYNTKTYAQTCQGNRQPMGLTNEKFEKYKQNVDNYLVINKNTYFCPRYWCPISEKPIIDKNKETCGNPDETPIDIYSTKAGTFNKSDEPRYVAYYNQNYLKPCCYIKNKQVVIKEDNPPTTISNQATTNKTTDNNSASNIHIYTVYNREIPDKRYGILPPSILEIINDNSAGLVCSKKLKSKLCAFRTGIPNKNKDLMDILTFLLNYETRDDLVKAIYNKLDLVKFISLENGYIAREFMKLAIYKNQRKISQKIFKRNYDIKINEKSLKNIQFAFNEFIDYLRYQKVLNPHYLYSVIALTLQYNLYIWKSKNENNFTFLLPLYVSYNDIKLLSGTEKAINIFFNTEINMFEPIVLKSTNNIQYTFDFTKKNVRLENESSIDFTILDKLLEYITLNKFGYKIKIVLLNNNLTVNHFVLDNNAIIKCKLIEPILLNKLFEIIECREIQLYDEFMYNDFEKNYNLTNITDFEIIHNNLKQQLFNDTIIIYNKNIQLTSEKNNILTDVDHIYANNITDSIFQNEIENHKDIRDWYNSFDFNNTFLTDKITYNKGNYSFSNKAINQYITFFDNKYKTNIINNDINNNVKLHNSIIVDLNNVDFTKGNIHKLPSKWNSYNFHYVYSNNYTNNTIFEFIVNITKIDKTDDIKKLGINNIKKTFGSYDGFILLCYLLNYKSIIYNYLNIALNTPIQIVYDKFNKFNNIKKEEFINNIIPKFDTSEIHLYSVAELLDIIIIVIHHRTYALLNKSTEKPKRNSIEDIGETCNMFINNKLKNSNYDKYPLIIIYSDENRLYFVNKQYYTEISKAPDNIKEIIKYKLKTFKKLV